MSELNQVIEQVSNRFNADIILYSGEITLEGAENLMGITSEPDNENVFFVLCTPGGCPNAAFKMARRLQDKYKKFILYVHGFCKSAGTFIAIGSDQIIMSDFAEFGPLDVQLQEKDEIARYSSGLNVNEALVSLKQEARVFFRQMVLELTAGAGLSTKMATEIASKLSIEFFSPIVSQIEPMKIGEIRRALRIALAYGERLIEGGRGNLKSEEALAKLVETYPDHGFVIDFNEAKTLFKNVSKEDSEIEILGKCLSHFIKYPSRDTTIINKIYPSEEMEDGPTDKPKDSERAGESKRTKGSPDPANSGKGLSAEVSKKVA